MRLKYSCPGCGTPLGYEGLCWKCKAEQERNAAHNWTAEEIAQKQENLLHELLPVKRTEKKYKIFPASS